MKKMLLAAVALLSVVMIGCDMKHDTPIAPPQLGNIGLTVSDTTISLGSQIVLNPKFSPAEGNTFAWKVNDQQVSTNQNYTFAPTEKGIYRVSLTVTNKTGMSAVQVVVRVLLTSDFYILNEGSIGKTMGSLSSFNALTEELTFNVFSAANGGATFGNTACYAGVWDETLYVVSKQGNRLVSADWKTLKQKAVATELGGRDGRAFAGVTPTEGVVTTNHGAFRVTLATLEVTGNALPGTENLDCGAVTVVYGHLYIATENNQALVYKTSDYTLVKTIENIGVGFARTADGKLWGANHNILVSIDPATLNSEETTLPADVNIYPAWGGWKPTDLSAAPRGNTLYFVNAPSEWGGGNEIYRYVVGDLSSLNKPFIKSTDLTDSFYGASIGVDPATGNIVGTFYNGTLWDYNDNRLVIFDAKTGGELLRKTYDGYWFPEMILFR